MLLHAITMLIYAAYMIAGGTFPAMLKKHAAIGCAGGTYNWGIST